ncbi:ankyrin repeat domain-containing protein 1-like [Cylas formicarius]|uniref:ankyrin repeat domain-containing protein 1-like n=1 Tax=Cylas formicarius TaxID=197179 RepID=UPI002958501F|nr:ankyrin repeat domain-containing protein 1-like [Cylas formicarius]
MSVSSEDPEPRVPPKSPHPILVDDDKNTALHYAAANGEDESVVSYLEKQSPVADVENYLGWTPLMMACRRGHLATAKILLDYKADASRKNKFGMNVFLICVASGNLEMVQIILEHLLLGGISKQSLQTIFSPLSMAVLFRHDHILQYLLEKRFDLNAKTHIADITPLMFATAMENSKAFQLLLGEGADHTMKNYLGHTPQDITTIRVHMKQLVNQEHKFLSHGPQTLNQGSQSQMPSPKYYFTCNQSPQAPLSSFAQFFRVDSASVPHMQLQRKYTNVSPMVLPATPNISSVTPATVHYLTPQIFFPPDFSPRQVSHNMAPASIRHDILNARLNSSAAMFLSPPVLNFLSPCM